MAAQYEQPQQRVGFPVSWIEVINSVDALPQYDFGNAFKLFLPDDDRPHGLVKPEIAQMLANSTVVKINFKTKEMHLQVDTNVHGRYGGRLINSMLKQLVDDAHAGGAFLPDSSRMEYQNDLVRIPGALTYPHFYEMYGKQVSRSQPVMLERVAAEDVFAVCRRDIHTISYVPNAFDDAQTSIWVQSDVNWGDMDATIWFDYKWTDMAVVLPRLPAMQMLARYGDNSKTLSTTESSIMPDHKDLAHLKLPQPVTYMTEHAGRVTPVAAYVTDQKVDSNYRPQPRVFSKGASRRTWKGPEVAPGTHFLLLDTYAVKFALKYGHFKDSAVMVMLDFLVRHRCITAASDPVEYPHIVKRLRRRHPVAVFPEDDMLEVVPMNL